MEPEIKTADDEKKELVKEVNAEESGDATTEPQVVPPEDFLIKHPLQCSWTLWFYDSGRFKVWEENQRKVITFETIEDFWSVFNHIKAASELRQSCDYSLFKNNIRPMWEDTANRKGGRWLLNLDKKQRNEELDKLWLELMLLMIGEGFDSHSDEICGAVINKRAKGDKIAVWTADFTRTQSILDIGRKVKSQLGLSQQLEYQAHKDTATKSGSMVKNMHTL